MAIVEIGGTVGDIESQPFLEAIRQMKIDLQSYQTLYMHLTLLPFLKSAGETKTKPTQRSVKEMLSHGLQQISWCVDLINQWKKRKERKLHYSLT